MDINWASRSRHFSVNFQTAHDRLGAFALHTVVFGLLKTDGWRVDFFAVLAFVQDVIYDASASILHIGGGVIILLNNGNALRNTGHLRAGSIGDIRAKRPHPYLGRWSWTVLSLVGLSGLLDNRLDSLIWNVDLGLHVTVKLLLFYLDLEPLMFILLLVFLGDDLVEFKA